ncbi:GHKL domain-containing protein [Lysinibacillus fusiformis]|nr:GHKL domain-containing protein [Lysinibacillus fusiformis]
MILLLLKLFEFQFKQYTKNILIFIFFYSILTTSSIYFFDKTEFRFSFNIIMHFFLVFFIFHFPISFAIIFTTMRTIVQVIIESIIFSILLYLGKLNILDTDILIISISLIFNTSIIFFTLLLRKTNISLRYIYVNTNSIYNKYLSYIIIMFFLLISIILVDDLRTLTNPLLVITHLFKIIMFLIIILFIIIKFSKKLEENYLKKAELVYLENIQGLIDSVKIQQHDHLNHLSVIRKLLDEKKSTEIENYFSELYGDISKNQNILKINHLPLAALIQTKMDKAKKSDINFNIEINTCIKPVEIKSYELVQVVGNIIDNAIEEEEKHTDKQKEINISIDSLVNSFLVISLNNKNSRVQHTKKESIFKNGYSSKGNNRGLGLFISQCLLKKYHGYIEVNSNEFGTTFTIFLPYK